MSIRRSLSVSIASIAVGATLLVGCGDDGGPSPSADARSVSELLAELPELDRSPNPIVVWGDVDRATELAGVERPVDLDDTDALYEWAIAITGGPQHGTDGPNRVSLAPPEAMAFEWVHEWAAMPSELGYSPLAVGRYIELQSAPQVFSVLDADADRDDLTAAIGEPDDGVWLLGDEDNGIDLTARGPGRELGQSLRFGLRDGWLAISRVRSEVESWLGGDHRSLAESDPAVAAVAEALDDADVYTAMLVLAGEAAIERDSDPLAPYQAMGVGLSVDGDTAVVTAVYAHRDEDVAAANADALRDLIEEGQLVSARRPFSDFVELDDVRVDGGTVVVSMRLDGPAARAWQMFITGDLPNTPTPAR